MYPISQSTRLPAIERNLNSNLQVVFRFEEEDGCFFIRPEIHRDGGVIYEAKLKNIPSSFTSEQWERVQDLLRDGAIKCAQQTIEFPLKLLGGGKSGDEEELIDDSFAFDDKGLKGGEEEDLVDRFNEAKREQDKLLGTLTASNLTETSKKQDELEMQVSSLRGEILELIEDFPRLVGLRRDPIDLEPLIRDMVRLSCSQDKVILTAILESYHSVLQNHPTTPSLYTGLADVLHSIAYHHSLDFVSIAQEVMEELKDQIPYPPLLKKALEQDENLKRKLENINKKHKKSTFEKMSKAISKVAEELESELKRVQKGYSSKENQELFDAWQKLTDGEKEKVDSSLKKSLSHFPSKFMERVEKKALVDFNALGRLRDLICSSARSLDLNVYSQTLLEAELAALNGVFWVMITHHYSNFNDEKKKELLSWAKEVKRRTLTTDKNTSRARAKVTRRREFANPAIAFQAASLREALTRLATDTTKLKRISDKGIPGIIGLVAVGGLAAAAIAFASPIAGVGVATAASASGLEYFLENHSSEVEGLPLDLRKGVTAGKELAQIGHPSSKHFWYDTLYQRWIPLVMQASKGEEEALQALQFEVKESTFNELSYSESAFLKMVYLLKENEKNEVKEIKKAIWNPTFKNLSEDLQDLLLEKALEAKWQQTLREVQRDNPVGKPSDWWKHLPNYKKNKRAAIGDWNALCDAVKSGKNPALIEKIKPKGASELKVKEAKKILEEELKAIAQGQQTTLQFEDFQPFLIDAPLKEIEEVASGAVHRNRWYPLHGLVVALEKHFSTSSSQSFRVYALELLVSLNTEGHLYRKAKRFSSVRKRFKKSKQFVSLKLFKMEAVQRKSYEQVFSEIEEVSESALKNLFWKSGSSGLQQLFREKELIEPLGINTVPNDLKRPVSKASGLLQKSQATNQKREELANCYLHHCHDLIFPWLVDVTLPLDDLFTTLVLLEESRAEKRVELQDLFGDGKKRVLVTGAAGSGKTTLVDRITNEWIEERLFREFDALYRLPFRELNLRKEDLKQTDPNEWLAAAVSRVIYLDSTKYDEVLEFNRKNPEKVLILLDGVDEGDTELVKKVSLLLNPQLNFHVLISTRHGFGRSIQEKVERKIENIGFSESQVTEFVQKLFGKLGREGEIADFLDAINKVQATVHTPIFLSMLCGLWIQGKKRNSSPFPSRMTQLYTTMVDQLHLWNARKEDPDTDFAFIDRKVVEALGRIAQEGIEGGVYIPAGLVGSILQEAQVREEDVFSIGILRKTGDRSHVFFLHPTFQEYLLAKWVSQQSNEERSTFIQDHWYQSHYQLVLSFLSGLYRDPQVFFNDLDTHPSDLCGYYSLELQLRCLGENPCAHSAFDTFFKIVLDWVYGQENQELAPFEWVVLDNLRTLFSYIQDTEQFKDFCKEIARTLDEPTDEEKISRAYSILASPSFFLQQDTIEKLLTYLQSNRYDDTANKLLVEWSPRLPFSQKARGILLGFLEEERPLEHSFVPLLNNPAPLEEWEKERLFALLEQKSIGPVWEAIASLLLDKPKSKELEEEVFNTILSLFLEDKKSDLFDFPRIALFVPEEFSSDKTSNMFDFKIETRRNRLVLAFIHMRNELPEWFEEKLIRLLTSGDAKLALDLAYILAQKSAPSRLKPYLSRLMGFLTGKDQIHRIYAAATLEVYTKKASLEEEEILVFLNVLHSEDSTCLGFMNELLQREAKRGVFTQNILERLFTILDSNTAKREVVTLLATHFSERSLEEWEFIRLQGYLSNSKRSVRVEVLEILASSQWTFSLDQKALLRLFQEAPRTVSNILLQIEKHHPLDQVVRADLLTLFESKVPFEVLFACAEVLIKVLEPKEIKEFILAFIEVFRRVQLHRPYISYPLFSEAFRKMGQFDSEILSKFFELVLSENKSIRDDTLLFLSSIYDSFTLKEGQVKILTEIIAQDPFGLASWILEEHFRVHPPKKSQVVQLLHLASRHYLPQTIGTIFSGCVRDIDPFVILEWMEDMELIDSTRVRLPFVDSLNVFDPIPLQILFHWFLKTESVRFMTLLQAQACFRLCPVFLIEAEQGTTINIFEQNRLVQCEVPEQLAQLVHGFPKMKYSRQTVIPTI